MNLLQTIKSLNPLALLAASPAARASTALRQGQTLGEVMREAIEPISRRAVAEALEEFSDGPAALLITCLIEATTRGFQRLAGELGEAPQLPREGAAWVCARVNHYGAELSGDLMSQHLINLVLSLTGLHVEALILTRAEIDARSLTVKLAELLKQGLSSSLSRSELAQTLGSPRPLRPRIAAPRPSAS